MARSKSTSAPAPMEISPQHGAEPVPIPGSQPVPPSVTPPMFGSGTWCPPCPPQSMAPSTTPYWIPGLHHPSMTGSSQAPWWAPPSNSSFAQMQDSDVQVWGVDSTTPGGFMNLLNKKTAMDGPTEPINGSSSQPISVTDDTNGPDCPRTCMLWTKDEDRILEFIIMWSSWWCCWCYWCYSVVATVLLMRNNLVALYRRFKHGYDFIVVV